MFPVLLSQNRTEFGVNNLSSFPLRRGLNASDNQAKTDQTLKSRDCVVLGTEGRRLKLIKCPNQQQNPATTQLFWKTLNPSTVTWDTQKVLPVHPRTGKPLHAAHQRTPSPFVASAIQIAKSSPFSDQSRRKRCSHATQQLSQNCQQFAFSHLTKLSPAPISLLSPFFYSSVRGLMGSPLPPPFTFEIQKGFHGWGEAGGG